MRHPFCLFLGTAEGFAGCESGSSAWLRGSVLRNALILTLGLKIVGLPLSIGTGRQRV